MSGSSSSKKRPSINLSLFINFSESFSSDQTSKSPNSTKSPRIFENGVVGLGIVAAMNEISDTHESNLTNKISGSPRSQPIPIVSAKPIAKFRETEILDSKKLTEPILEKEEMELSESYTCVISHFGKNNSVKKREYFDDQSDAINGNYWVNSGVFFTSPPKYSEAETVFQAPDFLNSCYLCKKKLHGLDIFMYRGDKAFCSAECRFKKMISDERKEKRGSSGTKKPFDYSTSPCSAPRFFAAGVAAA
ncbi:Protein of unknown function DUF581 [Macleaya cordata]|uniref:FLZ-type domain-containing protein n=1 Tax=Macleaya cordata TaxID=56857 RepID=A0A200R9A5_MACCD|nr:Protein of unknown function DUF581 [Macleaya cordata]